MCLDVSLKPLDIEAEDVYLGGSRHLHIMAKNRNFELNQRDLRTAVSDLVPFDHTFNIVEV